MKKDSLIAIAIIAALFGGIYVWLSGNAFHQWKEEVKLADGSTIVVDQKRRFDGRVAREAWLDFTVPALGKDPIEWHESLSPLVLNVSGGKLYLVAYPPTKTEQAKYGNPNGYVSYQWNNGAWKRIPTESVPANILDTNLLIWPVPNNESRLLTLAEKSSPDYNGSPKIAPELKHPQP